MTKLAILPFLARAGLSVGKWALKNPMSALGAAFTATDVAGAAKKGFSGAKTISSNLSNAGLHPGIAQRVTF